jgi:hypothetical protein
VDSDCLFANLTYLCTHTAGAASVALLAVDAMAKTPLAESR